MCERTGLADMSDAKSYKIGEYDTRVEAVTQGFEIKGKDVICSFVRCPHYEHPKRPRDPNQARQIDHRYSDGGEARPRFHATLSIKRFFSGSFLTNRRLSIGVWLNHRAVGVPRAFGVGHSASF
jgi:hypothetical protein